ncbi:MAG TPA: POTRA domain-containing protein [Saprospiraceae bacterium]|nr:POTRA domain-containing protein [Saprospiraceae bacterium]
MTIKSIEMYGLKRTKEKIVLRELTFATGDTLPQAELGEIIERNRNNLLNLGLFNEVEVNIAEWDTQRNEIEIVIEFNEAWYVYAVPIAEIADRNFNVWWTTYDHDLARLNLGARLDYLNFSGHNDKFKAKWQVGYTPKQEIEYRFPYFNKKQSLGLTTGFLHSINKEISFESVDNNEKFIMLDERKLQDRLRAQVKLQLRQTNYLRHELALTYEQYKIDTGILRFNPIYFRNGGTEHSILIAKYSYEYDDRDLRIYPSKGIKAVFEAEKIGWGQTDDENSLTSTVSMEWNHHVSKRWLQRISGIGQYSLSRSRPSFIHYKALGYNQKFVRGYELYVIDGLDYLVGKYQISYQLLQKEIQWRKLIPVEQFRKMPLEVYLSFHLETGRVNDPFTGDKNPLANTWLFGEGLGLNVLLYHNFLIQFNMNRNHLGEVGFFIHNHTSF